jgi:hypothetical protein
VASEDPSSAAWLAIKQTASGDATQGAARHFAESDRYARVVDFGFS